VRIRHVSTTHFGSKTVPEEEKENLVGKVFSSVAKKYDTMNDVMSLGIHRLWKDEYVNKMMVPQILEEAKEKVQFLDVAGGTGDIALRILAKSRRSISKCSYHMKVVDINPQMLAIGERKSLKAGVDPRFILFQEGNAEKLHVADKSVDLYTIAFGIRNCTHIDKVLAEAYRVLKTGGMFSCLEFSKLPNETMASLYKKYSFSLIPLMGQIVAADRDSYQYLVESIENFPSQRQFATMIEAAGFELAHGSWQNLSYGIAAIHTAVKV